MINLSKKQKLAVRKLKRIYSKNEFFWNVETMVPKFIKGTLSYESSFAPLTIARNFLEDTKGLLDMQEGLEEQLDLIHKETDKHGFHHVHFHQTLNGLSVFEASTQVHINPEGEVMAYKDNRISKIGISLIPELAEMYAVNTALKDVGLTEQEIKSETMLTLFRDGNKTICLAWEVELKISGELDGRHYFIDAHNGIILYKFSQNRGAMSRMTYTANNQQAIPGDLLVRDSQTTMDYTAQKAHDHIATVYDYYKDTFGRDSYDGNGAELVSTVHYSANYNNAYWSDYYRQMVYGDGDGATFKSLALALDIVGHEFTHAVTSRTARFVYAEEAGALDESFADVFGVFISNDGWIKDWEIGEGVYTPYKAGDALRDLSCPAKYGQPEHMNDFIRLAPGELPDDKKNDNGYVHYNSGIPNKFAYLLITGGTFHTINVKGIGRYKAEQICYLALTVYLKSSTRTRWTFKQARYAMLNACRQLYGDSDEVYASVKNAWAAVGVGSPAGDFSIINKTSSPNIPVPDNNSTGIKNSV